MVMSLFYINNFDYSVTVSFLSMSEDLIPDFTVCLMSCLNLAAYSSILIPSSMTKVNYAFLKHLEQLWVQMSCTWADKAKSLGPCRNESETSQQGCQVC